MNAAMQQVFEPKSALHVSDACTSCDNCRSVCQSGAIQGEPGKKHWIDLTRCVSCGQCMINCQSGAISDVSMIPQIQRALADPRKVVVVKGTPFIKAALGEYFEVKEESVPGKFCTALRELGFDKVFESEFNTDLTIMEEGTELIHRLYKGFGVSGFDDAGPLPQITSWCTAWTKYAENKYPELLQNLSSAKSPQQMFGKLAKSYSANKMNVNPANMYVVAVMSCVAKKYEGHRSDERANLYEDVDAALTTRELIQMIEDAHIDFSALPETKADQFMASYPAGENLFGAYGGILEATLKVTYELLSGEQLEQINFSAVPDLPGVMEAHLEIPLKQLGKIMPVNVCTISELKCTDEIIKSVLAGKNKYHFIDVITCKGGCVNGGGQPFLIHKDEKNLRNSN